MEHQIELNDYWIYSQPEILDYSLNKEKEHDFKAFIDYLTAASCLFGSPTNSITLQHTEIPFWSDNDDRSIYWAISTL